MHNLVTDLNLSNYFHTKSIKIKKGIRIFGCDAWLKSYFTTQQKPVDPNFADDKKK